MTRAMRDLDMQLQQRTNAALFSDHWSRAEQRGDVGSGDGSKR